MVYTACLPVCGMSVAYIPSTRDARTRDDRYVLPGWLDGAFDSAIGGL